MLRLSHYTTVQSLLINARNKPDKFTEGMDVKTWLEQLEAYLGPIEKQLWLPIAIAYISEKSY